MIHAYSLKEQLIIFYVLKSSRQWVDVTLSYSLVLRADEVRFIQYSDLNDAQSSIFSRERVPQEFPALEDDALWKIF